MIGKRTMFHIVQTTVALVIVTSLNDEPSTASLFAIFLFVSNTIQAPNSSPARNVMSIQDHPVNEIKNAAILCIVILACIMTTKAHRNIARSTTVVLGIPNKYDASFSSSYLVIANGSNSNGIGL